MAGTQAEKPVISVIMAVYNAEEDDLRAAVTGILNQSFRDFEFIIINDGSVNDTGKVLAELAAEDARIRIIEQENRGLTRSLNRGITEARGEFIARQDADDISYPQRFEKQLALFADSQVVLAGGSCDDLYPDGHRDVWGCYGNDELQKVVFYKTPFPHSTAMMRTSVCRELDGYDESYRTSQDMELWMRFAKKGRLAMVAEPVLLRKIGAGSISSKRRWRQFADALRARWSHNRGCARLCAVWYAVRGLVIGLLPHGVIRTLKKARA